MKNPVVWIVGGVGAFVLLAVIGTGAAIVVARSAWKPIAPEVGHPSASLISGKVATNEKPMSAAEFDKIVKGCTSKKEILERLGTPDQTSPGGTFRETWRYSDRVIDPITGKPWGSLIYFKRGSDEIDEVSHY